MASTLAPPVMHFTALSEGQHLHVLLAAAAAAASASTPLHLHFSLQSAQSLQHSHEHLQQHWQRSYWPYRRGSSICIHLEDTCMSSSLQPQQQHHQHPRHCTCISPYSRHSPCSIHTSTCRSPTLIIREKMDCCAQYKCQVECNTRENGCMISKLCRRALN